LTYVAKVALTLSHINAIPERGFSVNNALLGKGKLSLGENTIAELHIVRNTIRLFGYENSVPNTKDLLTAARKAHSQLYLEEQRRQKAAELHKAVELENELADKRQVKNKRIHSFSS